MFWIILFFTPCPHGECNVYLPLGPEVCANAGLGVDAGAGLGVGAGAGLGVDAGACLGAGAGVGLRTRCWYWSWSLCWYWSWSWCWYWSWSRCWSWRNWQWWKCVTQHVWNLPGFLDTMLDWRLMHHSNVHSITVKHWLISRPWWNIPNWNILLQIVVKVFSLGYLLVLM